MKLIVVALLVLGLWIPAGGAVESVPVKAGKQDVKKGTVKKQKKKVAKKDLQQMRKKAEADANRHKVDMQRREYQMMLEAQRRGMMQQQQQMQPHGK